MPAATPAAFRAPEVVYLDNHLLVVVKPAGLLAQADRTGDPDLVTWAKGYLKARFDRPGAVFVGLVHRLDRPVSGLVVLARTSKAAARLSEAFRTHAVEKGYLALVEGFLEGAGVREDWLLKADEQVRVVPEGTPGARRARLRWAALAHAAGRTLVRVDLETGRAHQIRVQLAALGHPIAGDGRYGARGRWGGAGLALHAGRLVVPHPTRGESVGFVAPPEGWPAAFAPAMAGAWTGGEGGAKRP